MITVTVELTDGQAAQLAEEAARLGLRTEELVRAAIADAIEGRDPRFLEAARRILEKNALLYEQLA